MDTHFNVTMTCVTHNHCSHAASNICLNPKQHVIYQSQPLVAAQF